MVKLVALDLDGTLTQHKSPLSSEAIETLNMLSERFALIMIAAGACERVYRQMGGYPIEIIGYYGMQASIQLNGAFEIVENIQVEPDRDLIFDRIEQLRKELGFIDYLGDSVEFHRSGLITFPLLGTRAPLEEKLVFDTDRKIRRTYYSRVCELFSEYNVFIGGSSSYDIAPKPYCKLYALENYLIGKSIEKNEVIYFGDDYGIGGNDSDVFNSTIEFIKIDNYRDFPRKAKELLL